MRRFLTKFLILCLLLIGLDRASGAILCAGLEKYLGIEEPSEVLLVGHSHTMLGLDSDDLGHQTGKTVAKYALNGAGVHERQAMLQHYLNRFPGSVKTVVYDVDSRLFGAPTGSNVYRLLYPFIEDPAHAALLRERAGSTAEFEMRRFLHSLRYNATLVNLALRGLLDIRGSMKTARITDGQLDLSYLRSAYGRVTIDHETVHVLEKSLQSLQKMGIQVILCYIPVVDRLAQVDPEGEARALNLMRAVASRYDAHFLDFQDRFSDNHALFVDPIHLNRKGQKAVTAALGQYLNGKEATAVPVSAADDG